jgi:MFS family permease
MCDELPRPVLLLSLSRLCEAVGNGFVVLVLPTSVALLPHSVVGMPENTRVGLLVSLFGLVLAVSQPVVGRFATTHRAQLASMFGGVSAFAVATALMSLATEYWQLLALRVSQGLCMAFVVPSTLALIAHYARPGQRGGAMGFYGMARMVGFGIGPILGGAVLFGLDSHHAYLVAAVPGAFAGVLVWLAVRPSRAEAQAQAEGAAPGPASEARPAQPRPAPPPDPGLRPFLPLAMGLFACACSLSIMAVLENQFMARLGQNPFEFGVAFAAAVLVRVFADWPLGRLSDRVGRKILIVPGLIALGPLTVLMAYAPTTAWLTVVRVSMGLAMGCVSPTIFALASDHAPPPHTARRMAWVTSGFALGLAVGPLLTGVVADATGFAGPFWLFGAMCLASALYVAAAAHEAAPGPSSGRAFR